MDPTGSSAAGSGNGREIAETLRFEAIHSLMGDNEAGPQNGSSFTALLGLPPNQAMELLHEPEPGHSPAIPPPADIWQLHEGEQKPLDGFPFGCFPTFPSNADLVERAARFSVFAAEDSPQTTSSGRSNSGAYLTNAIKAEPVDSDSNPNSSAGSKPQQQRPPKRKGHEKTKAAGKGCAKRARSSSEDGIPRAAEESHGGGEKETLPYVHVRARRGQATDSHSLAERARREKINARMKLLQELVPGCNKISGTAQVLDEIINHVQSLQRHVEFLSMRLAQVNPRFDFSGLDSFLAANGRMQEASGDGGAGLEQPSMWPDAQRQQQIWLADLLPTPHSYSSSSPPPFWGRDDVEQPGLVPPGSSLFGYDSLNSGSLLANQLKQEI